MTPIELFNARAALGGAIGMTLQEWRELTEYLSASGLENEEPWADLVFGHNYLGKQVLIGIEVV
jgi:hypothetical protein